MGFEIAKKRRFHCVKTLMMFLYCSCIILFASYSSSNNLYMIQIEKMILIKMGSTCLFGFYGIVEKNVLQEYKRSFLINETRGIL